MRFTLNKDRISLILFVGSLMCFFFIYGGAVIKYKIFPYKLYSAAKIGYAKVFLSGHNKDEGWFFRPAAYPDRPAIYNSGRASEGLNLVVSITARRENLVTIMDLNGKVIHRWILDWFKIWPDAKHVPERWLPKSRPGVSVHGILLMENGDLVFNFSNLGLVRVDVYGKVVWRLPYRTHHSIVMDGDGNLWVCGLKEHEVPNARFPGFLPPFAEDMILVVSPEGKIIREWSVPDLLRKNDLAGLLYMPLNKGLLDVDDRLHLNNAEPFPATFKEGFFKKGDVLVSLRNINTVLVFNRESEKINFIMTGQFVKQHDPDFIDGNSFSVFDNNWISAKEDGYQSRILIVSAPEKTVRVFFEGGPKTPFYTKASGKHMWLPNGNLLITETEKGRAFEIDSHGEIVWEYNNYIGNGKVGIVEEVQRLSGEYARLFKN